MVWVVGLNYCPQSPCYYSGNEPADPGDLEYRIPFGSGPNTTAGFSPPDNEWHPKYYERQDLRAQETMARATNAIVMLTFVGLGISVSGAGLLIWNLVEARKSSDAAIEANRLVRQEQRPWMSVSLEGTPGIHRNKDGSVRIHLTPHIRNHGKSVAHIRSWDFEIAELGDYKAVFAMLHDRQRFTMDRHTLPWEGI